MRGVFFCLKAHYFYIFFKAPVVERHHLCGFHADIAEMPAFSEEAGLALLFLREADDEAVFVAVLVEPFLLLGAGEADTRHGDVKREAGHVLAGACGRDGLVGRGEAAGL